jgi:RNA polymerase sigma factor for flagellar operon FliA
VRLWSSYRKRRTEETRNRLVEAYQPLVRQVVRRFAQRLPRSVDRGDLETAANVGLIAAVEAFDASRGVRFESYCELRAKGALLDELRTQDWLPRPWRQKVELHKRTLERLRTELECEPSDTEVASAMGMPVELYRSLFSHGTPIAPSYPSQTDDEPGERSYLESLPDRRLEGPDERLTREELLHLVTDRLCDQEARILYLKYWEELPMREIGELTGLSESRVCKVHSRLIERLRDRLRVHHGDS